MMMMQDTPSHHGVCLLPGWERCVHSDQSIWHPALGVQQLQREGAALVWAAAAAHCPANSEWLLSTVFLVSYVHGNWKWILLNCLTCLQCPNRPWADRQWGLCIFDDVVEHCSPSSFKYAEYFLRPMIQSLCDTSPEVRQAAAYGVGVMAQFGGENYRPFCTGMTWSLLYLLAVQLFSDTYMMCSGLSSSSQRPSPCWSESSRQLTRAQRKTSTLQRTASLLWESSWGSDQSASTLTRSFPTGSAGYRSKRTKRRRSTLLTSSVTSLRGRVPRLHFPDCLWTTSTLHTWPLNPFSTATTRLSSDQRTQIFLKFSSS